MMKSVQYYIRTEGEQTPSPFTICSLPRLFYGVVFKSTVTPVKKRPLPRPLSREVVVYRGQKKNRAHHRTQQGVSYIAPNTRDVVGYEGLYKVTEDGRVWSIKKGRWMSVFPRDGRGWFAVQLSKAGKQKLYRVHRIVAEAYIPNPQNKPHVNHIDCNKLNNHYTNLEWVTHQENTDHAKANGLMWYQKEATT